MEEGVGMVGCKSNCKSRLKLGVVPDKRKRRSGTQPQDFVKARDDNSESSPNNVLWWVPDLRAAARRLSGTTAENGAALLHRVKTPGQNALLRVQAVFGLVKHDRLRAVDHLVGDLLAAMGGQAVHEQRVGLRQ